MVRLVAKDGLVDGAGQRVRRRAQAHRGRAPAEGLLDAADAQHELVGALHRRQSSRARREVLDVDQALDSPAELHRHAARHLDVRALVAEKVARHRNEVERSTRISEGAHNLTERRHCAVFVDGDLRPRCARQLDRTRLNAAGAPGPHGSSSTAGRILRK